jgi:YopT-type cysteine protease-like protein
MINVPNSSLPSLSTINMDSYQSGSKHLMPNPSNLNHSHWSQLPPLLKHSVLARFDQNLCTNNHGISQRAMCFGLSLSWLEKIKHHGSHANTYASAERMNYLASFNGVIDSRIVHNFYRYEHSFQMKEAISHGDLRKAYQAGTDSMLQAAEYKNIKLKPMVKNQDDPDIPFLTMSSSTSTRRDVKDNDAFNVFQTKLAETKKGILSIYSQEGSHALGFSESGDGKKIIFDPSYGEFEFHQTDFKEMISTISELNNLPLAGVQIFKAK